MTGSDKITRIFFLFGGVFGCAGVALAAASAHAGGDPRLLASASAMCLAHAPALVALAFGAKILRTAAVAGMLMIAGTLLFSGDLVMLRFTEQNLFPYAAPTGGWAMMLGWLAVAAGGFVRQR